MTALAIGAFVALLVTLARWNDHRDRAHRRALAVELDAQVVRLRTFHTAEIWSWVPPARPDYRGELDRMLEYAAFRTRSRGEEAAVASSTSGRPAAATDALEGTAPPSSARILMGVPTAGSRFNSEHAA